MIRSRTWFITLLILLVVSVSGCILLYLLDEKGIEIGDGTQKKSVANVYLDGTCIYSVDLSKVEESYEFTVSDGDGGYNVIRIERGRIAVTEADCPDEICVRQGWLEKGVMPIVCLPHKLVIRLEGEDGIDAVTR